MNGNGSSYALSVNAGSSTTTFSNAVGNSTALTDFDVTATTINLNTSTVIANAGGGNTITFTGAVVLGTVVTITTDGTNDNNINFTSTINADNATLNNRALSANANGAGGTGTVTFGGIVGGSQALADLDATGATIYLNAATFTINDAGGGTATFTGAVVLGANVTFSTDGTADNNLSFTSTINSTDTTDRALSLAAGSADITVTGAIGATNDLASLSISGNDISLNNIGNSGSGVTGDTSVTGDTNGTVTLTGTTYKTAGTQVFNAGGAARTITLNEAATFTTTDNTIAFTGVVNSQASETNAVTLAAGTAQVTFNNNVGASQSIGLLTKQGSGDVKFTSASLTATGLTLSAGTINNAATDSGTWTVSGNVTISAGTLKATTNTFYVGGNWTNSSTFTPSSGTVNFNGSGTQQVNAGGTGAGKPFNDLTKSGSGILQLTSTGIGVSGNFQNTGVGGTFDCNSQNQNFGGDFSLSSGANWTKGGTLTFDGSGTNSITDSNGTKQDLGAVSVSGTNKTLSTSSSVDLTSITIEGADDALNISDDTFNILGSGTAGSRPFILNGGSFTATNSTVKYTGTGDTTIQETNYNHLELSPSGGSTPVFILATTSSQTVTAQNLTIGNGANGVSVTAATNNPILDINGDFSMSSGGSFTGGTQTITVGTDGEALGDFTLANGATWTAGSGTLILDGGDDVDLVYFNDQNGTKQNMGNVQIGASPATTNMSSNMVANSLTVSSGDKLNTRGYDLDIATYITVNGTLNATDTVAGNGTLINLGTDWTVGASATFTASTSLVTFDGSGAQSISPGGTDGNHDFNNLTVANTGGPSNGVTFSDSCTVGGTFADNTADSKVIFTVEKTFVFQNIDIDGSSDHNVTLTSTNASPGTPAGLQWFLNVAQTSPVVSYVTVYDSDANGGNEIDATNNCTGADYNNEHWNFGAVYEPDNVGHNSTYEGTVNFEGSFDLY